MLHDTQYGNIEPKKKLQRAPAAFVAKSVFLIMTENIGTPAPIMNSPNIVAHQRVITDISFDSNNAIIFVDAPPKHKAADNPNMT